MSMLGILAALGTAVANSGDNLSIKRATKEITNIHQLSFVRIGISTFVLIIALCVVYPALIMSLVDTFVHLVKPDYWNLLLLSGLLNAVALFFQVRALKLSDASLVAPITLLTPAILLFTSPLMLGQAIPFLGVVGVCIIIFGVYLLGFTKADLSGANLLRPFTALFEDKGARSMFVTASIWGVTSNIDKMGVDASSPMIWSGSVCFVMMLIIAVFWYFNTANSRIFTPSIIKKAAIPGTLNAVSLLLQMYAITLLPVPYVIALKRTSAVMTVMAGKFFFGEQIGSRLIGASVMLSGVVLIAFSL